MDMRPCNPRRGSPSPTPRTRTLSGSRDIGPDKEWDHKSWTYHGRNLDNFDPTDDDIRKWRAKVEEEQERLRRQ